VNGARPVLDGIRVVDMGWVWSAPMVASMLADLGAEVIKVEHRGRLDNTRLRGRPTVGPPVEGPDEEVTPYFHQVNHGKLSFTADLKHPDGQKLIRRLIDSSDVLIENLTPGVLARGGLAYDELAQTNPGLIMLSMSAVGQDGPLSGMRAYAPVMTSFSGAESLVGYDDEPSVGMITFGVGDPNAASHALVPLMAALIHRERTGRGQFIDLSQIEAMCGVLGEAVAELQVAGSDPAERGMRHPQLAPHGHYPCAGEDRWIALAAAGDEEWAVLAGALDPELASDARFASEAGRREHREALDAAIAAATARHDRDELFARLRAAGVRAAPLLGLEESLEDEHLRARGMFQTVEHPFVGDHEITRIPWSLGGTPARVQRPAPTIGQHTHDVATRVLGLSPEQIAEYEESGALR
jgi:crotonobetainyl-CoA:carnitine CoA-transferase CaiB-like acyl-CoA transferase